MYKAGYKPSFTYRANPKSRIDELPYPQVYRAFA